MGEIASEYFSCSLPGSYRQKKQIWGQFYIDSGVTEKHISVEIWHKCSVLEPFYQTKKKNLLTLISYEQYEAQYYVSIVNDRPPRLYENASRVYRSLFQSLKNFLFQESGTGKEFKLKTNHIYIYFEVSKM